jgi:hypothetical protein
MSPRLKPLHKGTCVFTIHRSRTTSAIPVAQVNLPLNEMTYTSTAPNCVSPGTRLIWSFSTLLTVGLPNCESQGRYSYSILGPIFDESHEHEILPGLSWVSDYNAEQISRETAKEAEIWCWNSCSWSNEWDEALLCQIRNFDFKNIRTDSLHDDWREFVNKLWERVR